MEEQFLLDLREKTKKKKKEKKRKEREQRGIELRMLENTKLKTELIHALIPFWNSCTH